MNLVVSGMNSVRFSKYHNFYSDPMDQLDVPDSEDCDLDGDLDREDIDR